MAVRGVGLDGVLSPAVLAMGWLFVVLVGGGVWAYWRTVRFRPGESDR